MLLTTAPTSRQTTPAAAATTREYGLDWLRVFAFLVLIFYHTGMLFVSWPWHVKNAETSELLEYFMLFSSRWRLPLLFFISGAGVYFSLRRRSFPVFARERLRRLLIPLAFGMLVVVPPQIYYERLTQGVAYASYMDFYPSVFDGVPYPKGNTSWHHLWFVAYILVYSLVGIPLFAFLRGDRGKRLTASLADALDRWRIAIYLCNIPSLLIGLTLGPHWPTRNNLIEDWANLTGSFVTFLWGFVICSQPRILDLLTRRRAEFLRLGIAVAVLFFTLRITGMSRTWPLLIGVLVNGYFGMLWIFALVGYARHHFHRDSPGLRYATEAVYPFYIAHQTITVALGFYIVKLDWPIAVKLPLVAAGTFFGSWLTYELTRRTALTRLLFGMKPTKG
jgi:surface polysaccharide O-acyltransferase-like enzyme